MLIYISFDIFRILYPGGNGKFSPPPLAFQGEGSGVSRSMKEGGHKFSEGQNTPPPYFLIEFRPLKNYFLDFYHNFFYTFFIQFLKNSHAKGGGPWPHP